MGSGPLASLRVIELTGLGPGPFAAMMLADMGADVLRVDRIGPPIGSVPIAFDVVGRGRRSVAIDLKRKEGVETLLRLADRADALIEGFRPGVAERLGIGPGACHARNAKLVYARMTGWGQDGPYAQTAGHDINYLALTGALDAIGRKDQPPAIPLNLVADYGGGGMLLAFGIVSAVVEARGSGQGQVIDAAMVDGASLLAARFHGLVAGGLWNAQRGTNQLDSGLPFYDVYETADGKYVAVGALEAAFYDDLVRRLGLDGAPSRDDRSNWPELRAIFTRAFKQRTRDEWAAFFDDTDACVSPVLSFAEAPAHPHNVARRTFTDANGMTQPAPAPRFSRTPGAIGGPTPTPGEHSDEALRDWGFTPTEIEALRTREVLA